MEDEEALTPDGSRWRDNGDDTNGDDMDGDSDGSLREWAAIGRAAVAAELAAGPPWLPVREGDCASLLVARRAGARAAQELRAVLTGLGIDAGEVAGLRGSVDADGGPAVALGTVTVATARHLAGLLRGGGPGGRRAA